MYTDTTVSCPPVPKTTKTQDALWQCERGNNENANIQHAILEIVSWIMDTSVRDRIVFVA
jgi:hypothetical protein